MSSLPISIDSLDKSFSNETVLRDIDLTVNEGEFCVVVGPSGCGKSTLLQCISGLTEYDTGNVELAGQDADTLSIPDRDLGYVFQEFEDALFPHMTVAENVAFGLRQQETEYTEDEIDQKIDEMLELLAISETRDSFPDELSGGQQQRVEVARQFARECDIMLLDDPLADLDYKLQKRMELEIRSIHQDLESTFLYVTHNQDQALKLADRVVVMNNGMIEQVGTPEEIYRSPETAFVGRFIGDSNAFRATVIESEDRRVVLDTDLGDLTARVTNGGASIDVESLCMVRPENIVIGEDAGAKENTITVELLGQTYTGEETELTFKHEESGETIQVTVPQRSELEAGDELFEIGWDAEDMIFYPELSVTETTTIDDLNEI